MLLNHGVHLVVDALPDGDRAVVLLSLRYQALLILPLKSVDLAIRFLDHDGLLSRDLDVGDAYGRARNGGVVKPHLLDIVEDGCGLDVATQPVHGRDQLLEHPLVDELAVAAHLRRQYVVEDDASRRCENPLPGLRVVDLNLRLQLYQACIVGHRHFVETAELGPRAASILLDCGEVVAAEDDLVSGCHQRLARTRREHVVDAQHGVARLMDCLSRQRDVYSHLVAVEVGVECCAHQRVDLDCAALDQHRQECLDAEPMQGRRAVEQHGTALDDFLQDVPDLGLSALDHPLCAFDIVS